MKPQKAEVAGRRGFFAAVVLIAGLMGAGPAMAQYGYTQGGYGGAAVGAMAGSAVGSALVAAAGISNPLLSGTLLATSTLGGGYMGARLGSFAGSALDRTVDSNTIWTTVGAVSGGLMGFIFGPSGSLLGKTIGTLIGSGLGSMAGSYLSTSTNRDYNPRTIGALIGGVNGALMAGPLGAAAGVPLGYIGGDLLDKYVFSSGSNDQWGSWDGGSSCFGEGSWGRSDSWQQGPPWTQGAREGGLYPPEAGQKSGSGYFSGSGYDRQGYDSVGYDREGYDREGYDKFGYNRQGVDRKGYDRKGFRPSSDAKTTSTYDPDVYDGYWRSWKTIGGDYPVLGKEHFDYFSDDVKSTAYQRYVSAAPNATDSGAASSTSRDLVTLKQNYRTAVEELQNLARSGASSAAQEEVRNRVLDLEKQLRQRMPSAPGGK